MFYPPPTLLNLLQMEKFLYCYDEILSEIDGVVVVNTFLVPEEVALVHKLFIIILSKKKKKKPLFFSTLGQFIKCTKRFF